MRRSTTRCLVYSRDRPDGDAAGIGWTATAIAQPKIDLHDREDDAHPARGRRAARPEAAQLSAREGGLRGRARARRPGGARELRAGPVRPRRARHHAAEARRPGGLPAPAREELGADHHADREGRGDRQGARTRARAPTTTSPSPSRCASSAAGCGRRCGEPRWRRTTRRRGAARARRPPDRLREAHHRARAASRSS